jgi:ferric iron reductase protein FhuF
MLGILRPLFPPPWERYGATLRLASTLEEATRPSVKDWSTDPSGLAAALDRYSEVLRCSDRRAVASAWSFRYFSALLPPVIAAASLLSRDLPVGWEEITVEVDANGIPVGFAMRHDGFPAGTSDARERYYRLVWGHLHPLLGHINRSVGIPARILWGNAHRVFGGLLSEACKTMPLTHPQRTQLEADRRALLLSSKWGEILRNPLFLRHPEAAAERASRHAHCCLHYLIPQRGYCTGCPVVRSATQLGRSDPFPYE